MENTTLEVGNSIKKAMELSASLIATYKDCVDKMDEYIEADKISVTRVNGITSWENYLSIKPIYVKIMLNLQLSEETEKLRVLTAQFKNL